MNRLKIEIGDPAPLLREGACGRVPSLDDGVGTPAKSTGLLPLSGHGFLLPRGTAWKMIIDLIDRKLVAGVPAGLLARPSLQLCPKGHRCEQTTKVRKLRDSITACFRNWRRLRVHSSKSDRLLGAWEWKWKMLSNEIPNMLHGSDGLLPNVAQ